MAPALAVMPCQSPIHQAPYLPRDAVVGSLGLKGAVVTRRGGWKWRARGREIEQDLVDAAVLQGKGRDREPACVVDAEVRLEVDDAVVGSCAYGG